MENNELTYWKNYQIAMQWIKGNTVDYVPETIRKEEENEELEFTIDDNLMDFYRLSRDHKTNRSKYFNRKKELQIFFLFHFRKSKITRKK